MKPVTITLAAAVLAAAAQAQQMSPAQALQRAAQSHELGRLKVRTADLRLAYTAGQAGADRLYVFDNTAAGGFVIVGADERCNAVLGYCETGRFDIDSAPANLRQWLADRAEEIAEAATATGGEAPLRAPRAPISPILTCRWNQLSPYNDQCPIYSGNERCVTGCTATAMAQIMYRHKWPARGTGSHSYTDNIRGREVTLSADFGATTYEWSVMSDTYDNRSSATSRNAVARLMAHIGIATEMDYDHKGVNQGGTPLRSAMEALVNYFGYDDGAVLLHENELGSLWEEMLYSELQNGRPLLYSGTNGQEGDGGHAYVIDGCDGNGLWHVNWGWGGQCDGYFARHAFKPRPDGDYSKEQYCVAGIRPAAGESQNYADFRLTGELTCNGTAFNRNSGNIQFSVDNGNGAVVNVGKGIKEVKIGFRFDNLDTGETSYSSRIIYSCGGWLRGYENVFNVYSWQTISKISAYSATFVIPAGKYAVSLAYQCDGQWHTMRDMASGEICSIPLEVFDNTLVFGSEPLPLKFEFKDYTKSIDTNGGDDIFADVVVTNVSEQDYTGEVDLSIIYDTEALGQVGYNDQSKRAKLTLNPGQSQLLRFRGFEHYDFRYHAKWFGIPQLGTYKLVCVANYPYVDKNGDTYSEFVGSKEYVVFVVDEYAVPLRIAGEPRIECDGESLQPNQDFSIVLPVEVLRNMSRWNAKTFVDNEDNGQRYTTWTSTDFKKGSKHEMVFNFYKTQIRYYGLYRAYVELTDEDFLQSHKTVISSFEITVKDGSGVDDIASDSATVEVEGGRIVAAGFGGGGGRLRCYNAAGAVVAEALLTDGRATVDIGTWPAGVYFVTAGAVTRKFVKH